MYKKNIETLLPIAMRVIEQTIKDHPNDMLNNGKLKSEFNGYFASFGPSVIISGLRQTITFYNDQDKKQKQGYVNKIIWQILQEMNWRGNHNALQDYVDEEKLLGAKSKILDIVAACKLAIRTFEMDK